MHRRMFGIVIASVLFGSSSPAQRDAPVWESYLTKISAFHHRDYATQFRFRWKKSGGPEESVEHQCYLVAYVKRDEEEILKIASDPKLLDREDRRSQGELFFDVLLKKELIKVLATKVAKRDRGDDSLDATARQNLNTFAYEFAFSNAELLEAMRALAGGWVHVATPHPIFYTQKT